MLGVTLSAAEKAGHNYSVTIGTDYDFPTTARLAYLEGKGITLVGLPVMWEQAQPVVESALDTDWVTAVQNFYAAKGEDTKIVLRVMTEGKKRVPSSIPATYQLLGADVAPARLEDFGDFVYRLTVAFPYSSYPDLWFCFGARGPGGHDGDPTLDDLHNAAVQRAATVIKQFDDEDRICIFEVTHRGDVPIGAPGPDWDTTLSGSLAYDPMDANGRVGGRESFRVGIRIYVNNGASAHTGGAVAATSDLTAKFFQARAAMGEWNIRDDHWFITEFGAEDGTDDLSALDGLCYWMKHYGVEGLYNACDNGSTYDIAPSGSSPSYTDAAQMAKIVANQF